jgi:hypothetical protein
MSMETKGKPAMPPGIWSGQGLNAFCLLALLTAISTCWTFLGKPYPRLFWVAVFFPIVHQVFVWLAWRLEFRSAATSKIIGFRGYFVIFFVLFGGRFVSLFVLAWADRGSLHLGAFRQISITIIFTVIGIYAMYSVLRYFGLKRAAGADHFDSRFRDMPFVKQGIFRFTNNGMYLYAFLLFWAIAIGFNSSAGIAVAAFSHAYIWVHFYSTEKPDMDYIYSSF